MKQDFYVFPAKFAFDKDGISVEFPDLPGCITCGDTVEEANRRAKEALALHLYGMEEDEERIPEATLIKDIKCNSDEVVMLIEVYMAFYREAIENQAVKKTLTIPRWLNIACEKNNINFSQVLKKALKEQLKQL
ncbi:type II toxin-antitoxin system HicB family antitoxin [uncultured Clostridium sp.]|uniref:type II toxin-antitoxin system HicB family antitoxin n=1 Tax=uncultured Clostridium sp. TaxID=59620 RepID=UPI0025F68867|nr:type II toxin-antitoxin system HicB family antitoxin [uncultured Clostridium sp.]